MEVQSVTIENPDALDVIVGQAHFIKTVDDLHEALTAASPDLCFGIAFCEASGPRLVRRSGNDEMLVALAVRNAMAVGAGHCFVIILRNGHPVDVLDAIKAVPEVCHVACATANPLDVLVVETERGRGIVGVVDGATPLRAETDVDVEQRHVLLRRLGYQV